MSLPDPEGAILREIVGHTIVKAWREDSPLVWPSPSVCVQLDDGRTLVIAPSDFLSMDWWPGEPAWGTPPPEGSQT